MFQFETIDEVLADLETLNERLGVLAAAEGHQCPLKGGGGARHRQN